MYRVMVVDDDRLVREDICAMVNWRQLGFVPPVQFDDGSAALDGLLDKEYDLVITDISMPVMNGVELIRAGRKACPDALFVVLSNYDDFDYVREAMKLGAVEYLLKYQLEPEALRKLLFSITDRLARENETKSDEKKLADFKSKQLREMLDYFWRDIYFGHVKTSDAIDRGDALHITLRGGMWIPLILEFEHEEADQTATLASAVLEKSKALLPAHADMHFIFIGAEKAFIALQLYDTSFLILANTVSQYMRDLLERFAVMALPVFVCAGKICVKFDEFPAALQCIKEFEPTLLFYYGFEKCAMNPVGIPGGYDGQLSRVVTELFDSVGMTTIEGLNGNINTLMWLAQEKRVEARIFKNKCIDLLKRLADEMSGDISGALRLAEKHQTLSGFKASFIEIIMDIDRQKRLVSNVTRPEIEKAVDYIYKNFARNITLGELADVSGLSRNYFSKIFKDETGMNYSEFLNIVRIERVKHLLRRDNLRTNEAAAEVGFEDYRYFCRIFKNITGVTCGEYRKQKAR